MNEGDGVMMNDTFFLSDAPQYELVAGTDGVTVVYYNDTHPSNWQWNNDTWTHGCVMKG